ncbi:hypothetical protein SOVF_184970, partial [Spinacia oleracea]
MAEGADQIDLLSEGEEQEVHSHRDNIGEERASPVPRVLLTGKKRQRRLTSNVWVHFDFLDVPDENGNLLCKCKKCGQTYNADSKQGTGNLLRHVKNCKMSKFRDVGQMILERTSSGLEHRLPVYNADYFRELVCLAIVRHDLPFQFVDTFMAVAVVLDPRFKIQFVEWSFKKVYGEGLEFEVGFSKVKDVIKTLYEAYVASYSSSHNSGSAVQGEGGRAVDASSGNCDELMDFDSFTNEQSNVAVKSEIQMYYEEPLIPRASKLDILNHWRACAVRYPILSTLAKDVLAVPVSTVASESAFSTGSRVLDCVRSSLSTKTVESIICLKDWTFGV